LNAYVLLRHESIVATPDPLLSLALLRDWQRLSLGELVVTELTNYTKLSKKIIHRADDLANLSPYNPVVREITTNFKSTHIPAKIVISLAVTITSYIKIHITDTLEFKHSYYKLSSNKRSKSL
jgi:hypothetical protein